MTDTFHGFDMAQLRRVYLNAGASSVHPAALRAVIECIVTGQEPAQAPKPVPVPTVDGLHPTGRCTCAGEGRCEWCQRICKRCGGDGVEPSENTAKLLGRVERTRIRDTEGSELEVCGGVHDNDSLLNVIWLEIFDDDPKCRILQFDYPAVQSLRDLLDCTLKGPQPTPPKPLTEPEELDALLHAANVDKRS